MGEAGRSLSIVEGARRADGHEGRSVPKSHLVNRLNYLNFQDQTILVNLKHVSYDDAVFLRVRPLPCAGERLECVWGEASGLKQLLRNYRFAFLLIPDGKKYLLVNSELVQLNEEGIEVILPGTCREYQIRRIRRHPGVAVGVELIQHGALFQGELGDFTPVALRVKVVASPHTPFQWINPDAPLEVRLSKGGGICHSGAFQVVSQESFPGGRFFVLAPLGSSLQRYPAKRYRNARQRLLPSPNIVFDHPLIGKRINLKVAELSGSGFSVEENEGDCVLMPGLILPELKLSFAQGFSVRLKAQVVHRSVLAGQAGEGGVTCGVALLDMEIRDHEKLLSILHQVANRRSYVGTEVDLDDLWDFFFETGFIYPAKYASFQSNKEEIKNTYAKLYGENPQIARHFIYQDRGAILGHLAMVRFYENAWMIHHHAARKSVTIKAGLAVLDQVSHYLNELRDFQFAHLRYVYCYYRPDNKFPARMFGGFAHKCHDQRLCSQDQFAYGHFRQQGGEAEFPERWELAPTSEFDRAELATFYRYLSGGLMIEAFQLAAGDEPDALTREYQRLGFKKEKYCYSLRKEGSLKAFLLVNCTDAGFNMADLTNCVTLIVLDDSLPRELYERSLERVSRHYEGGHMPVLTYPFSYLEKQELPYDKVYQLWILDLKHTDAYFEYCEGLFRTVTRAA